MRTFINITTIIILLAATPGCSRFRQLTRRDYAKLHDPFTSSITDEEAIAQHALERDRAEATAGVTRLGDGTGGVTRPTNAMIVAQSNPQPKATADGAGPSLSDFVGKTVETPVAETTASARAPMNGSDMADFTSFLEEQATARGMTETARELDVDFSEWAAAEKQEWQRETASLEEKAAPLISPIQQVSRTVSAADSADLTQLAATQNMARASSAAIEVATPLIQKNVAAQVPVKQFSAAKNTAAVQTIGTENPFAEINYQPSPKVANSNATPAGFAARPPRTAAPEPEWAASSSPTPAAKSAPVFDFNDVPSDSKRLDSGFNFDTGWKPSNLVQP